MNLSINLKSMFIAIAMILLVFGSVALLRPNSSSLWAREDGVYEICGAVGLAVAVAGFGLCALVCRQRNACLGAPLPGARHYLALALLMAVLLGEEVSWGQRVLRISSPTWFQIHNAQREITLHNMALFQQRTSSGGWRTALPWIPTCDRMFTGFWFAVCVVMPLGWRFSRRFAEALRARGVPPVSICIGLMFPLTYMASKALERYLPLETMRATVEAKEALIELLFGILAVSQVLMLRSGIAHARPSLEGSAVELQAGTGLRGEAGDERRVA